VAQLLIVERWASDDEKEEIHLFISGERNTYVLGYNPAILDDQEVRELLRSHGLEMP